MSLKKTITEKAHALGFDAVGFAPPYISPDQQAELRDYIAEERHGGMTWMAETLERRADPKVLWPEVRSVIVLGTNRAPLSSTPPPADRGWISAYACNRDYHDVLKPRLKALGRWIVESWGGEAKAFVDTAPVMEVPLAARAGLGWQGKHTNLVSRTFGSALLLGEVFTTLEIAPDSPGEYLCGSCRRCLDACPTGAFLEPGKIDSRRCLSYLTIEHKGPIPLKMMECIGNRIYGCDDCTGVCPWNRFAPPAREEALRPRPELSAPPLADLARLDEDGFRTLFRGTPVKRIGFERFRRNLLAAIGNANDKALAKVAEAGLDDPSEIIRVTARWAVERLR